MFTRRLRANLGAGILVGVMVWLFAASGAPRLAAAHYLSVRQLPLAAQVAISNVLGRDDPAYAVVATPNGYQAENSAHNLTMEFTAAGLKIRHGDAAWALQLLNYGYRSAESTVAATEPHVIANRVEYARAGLTEWYVNGSLGLEQGFTIERAPQGESQDGLILALALAGNLRARVTENGTALALEREDGSTALRYAGLSVQDAAGQSLPAWMEITSSAQANETEALLLHVDDRGAAYPLQIDPIVQKAQLTSSDGGPDDAFGSSVAINADGNTVVVGASAHQVGGNTAQGEAYVFVKGSAGWSGNLKEQARLTASDGAAYDQFGVSVGISGDGNTIVVGAYHHQVGSNWQQGEAYVFLKPGGGWSGDFREQSQLTSSDGGKEDHFGVNVAISADGNTIVVGAPWHQVGSSAYQGEAYVFAACPPSSSWCVRWFYPTQIARLVSSDGAAYDAFGCATGISGDGNTIVVGADQHQVGSNTYQGEAYVFVNLLEKERLTSSDGASHDYFGESVGINWGGAMIVVGAPYRQVGSNAGQGEAYVFMKPELGWSGNRHEDSQLISSDGQADDGFGTSVGFSWYGGIIVVGAGGHRVGSNANQGEAYVFVKPGTESEKLISSNGTANDGFGYSVAISVDGRTMVIGAPDRAIGNNAYQGAAYVFVNLPATYLPLIRR